MVVSNDIWPDWSHRTSSYSPFSNPLVECKLSMANVVLFMMYHKFNFYWWRENETVFKVFLFLLPLLDRLFAALKWSISQLLLGCLTVNLQGNCLCHSNASHGSYQGLLSLKCLFVLKPFWDFIILLADKEIWSCKPNHPEVSLKEENTPLLLWTHKWHWVEAGTPIPLLNKPHEVKNLLIKTYWSVPKILQYYPCNF